MSLELGKKCTIPSNDKITDEYTAKKWLKCARKYSKECTICLCKIHSIADVLGFSVPCCHGECKGKPMIEYFGMFYWIIFRNFSFSSCCLLYLGLYIFYIGSSQNHHHHWHEDKRHHKSSEQNPGELLALICFWVNHILYLRFYLIILLI